MGVQINSSSIPEGDASSLPHQTLRGRKEWMRRLSQPPYRTAGVINLLVGAAAVFLLTFFVFRGVLDNEFLNWDDTAFVTENPFIRGLGVDSLQGIFSHYCVSNYTPLERLSMALDYKIWGLDSRGFHFTNVILHCFNAAWVFLLTWMLLRSQPLEGDASKLSRHSLFICCGLAALLFSLHPLRVESVAWVSERRDVLSLFFLLPAVAFYLEAGREGVGLRARRWCGAGVWIFWLCSLLSKATAVTLPVLLLLFDFYPLRRFDFSRKMILQFIGCALHKIPFFLVSLTIGVIAIHGQVSQGAMVGAEIFPWHARLLTSCASLVFYVGKWFFPWPLSPIYTKLVTPSNLWSGTVILGVLWVLLVSFYSVRVRKSRPGITLAWFAFVIIILPLSGLMQAGLQGAADRYTYVSTIPFAILWAAGLYHLLRQSRWRIAGCFALGVTCVVLAFFSRLTREQIPVWKTSGSLWAAVMKVSPHEPVPLTNYSSALIHEGQPGFARVMAREALRRNPHYENAWHNHGIASSLTGRVEDAERSLRKALEIKPSMGETHLALANILSQSGRVVEARHHFFLSLQDGFSNERLSHLAMTLAQTGEVELALKYLFPAAKAGDPMAYVIWAKILASQSQLAAARSVLGFGAHQVRDTEMHKLHEELIRGDSALSATEKEKLQAELKAAYERPTGR